MVTGLVAPAAIVVGRPKPVVLNTPPVKLAAVTVTDPVPVFESVTVWLAVFPIKMLPNEMLVGETLNSWDAVTVTVATAVLVVSATLFAVTAYIPAEVGAVYNPADDTVPPVAVHVTDVLLEPVTLALNCCVAPV
jgi:hypothetical protein